MPSIPPLQSESGSPPHSLPPSPPSGAAPAVSTASPGHAAQSQEGLQPVASHLAAVAAQHAQPAPRTIGNLPPEIVRTEIVTRLGWHDREAFAQTDRRHLAAVTDRERELATRPAATDPRSRAAIQRVVDEFGRAATIDALPSVAEITARFQQAAAGSRVVQLDLSALAQIDLQQPPPRIAAQRELLLRACDAASRIVFPAGHRMEHLRLDVATRVGNRSQPDLFAHNSRVNTLLSRLSHVDELALGLPRGNSDARFPVTHELVRHLHRLAPDTLALRLPLLETAQILMNSVTPYATPIEGPDLTAQVRRLAVSCEWLREPQHEAIPFMFDDGGAGLRAQHLQRVNALFSSLQHATQVEVEPSHDTSLRFDPGALAYTANAAAQAPALRRLDLPALEAAPAEHAAAVAGAIDRLSQHPALLRVSIGDAVFERDAADQPLRRPPGGEPGPV